MATSVCPARVCESKTCRSTRLTRECVFTKVRLRSNNSRVSSLVGAFRAEGEAPSGWRDDALARVRFRIDGLDPSVVDVDNEWQLSGIRGSWTVSGELAGPPFALAEWNGTGQVEDFVASTGALELRSDSAAPWTLSRGRLRLTELHLVGAETDFTLEAEVSPFAEPFTWMRASFGAHRSCVCRTRTRRARHGVHWRDRVRRERPTGTSSRCRLTAGSRWTTVGLRSENLPLRLRISVASSCSRTTTVTLTRLDANVGGGTVQGEGEVLLAGASVASVELRGRARSVRLSYPEGLRSEIDGTIRLSGVPPAIKLTGDIALAACDFQPQHQRPVRAASVVVERSTLTPTESFADASISTCEFGRGTGSASTTTSPRWTRPPTSPSAELSPRPSCSESSPPARAASSASVATSIASSLESSSSTATRWSRPSST